MPDPREQELEAIARDLGGAWRIERGVMPVVVLTLPEARAALDRAAKVYVVEVGKHDRYVEGVYATRAAAEESHPGDWRDDILLEDDAPATAHRRLDLPGLAGTFHVWEYPVDQGGERP